MNIIIVGVIAFLGGALVLGLLSKKLNKRTISKIQTITRSEDADKDRTKTNNIGDEQIKSNNDTIAKAKKLIEENEEVIENAKKNS